MRSNLPSYELVAAKSLSEVLALLGTDPGKYRPLAGGTDLMVMLAAGKLAHTRYVSVWGLSELSGIAETKAHVTLGALTTYSEVQAHATLRREFPMLCEAGRETGGVAIQNRGTLGGNIANASPAADSPPALLAYGAELELVSSKGARWVPYDGFHTGYKTMTLEPSELVARVRLPRFAGPRVHFYRKVGPRRAQAISKVCFAGCADFDGANVTRVRIAIGGVAPIIPRCHATERALEQGGESALASAKTAFANEIAPIDDVRSNARYRRRVAENLLVDFVLRMKNHASHVGLGS
jgi:CO/xanthine dehydrogenase FAD-binding subunit